MNLPFQFNLGDKVKDSLTGAKGIVIARAEYLTGCNTYGIVKEKNTENKTDWFDELRLVLIKGNAFSLSKTRDAGGEIEIPESTRSIRG